MRVKSGTSSSESPTRTAARRGVRPAACHPRRHLEGSLGAAASPVVEARAPWSRDGSHRGYGLLSHTVFSMYDVNKSGRLGIAEFVRLLRDNGVAADYPVACRIMAGFSIEGIDFDSFLGLLASSLREPELCEEMMTIPRCIFNSYDLSRSGILEAPQYLELLADHSFETKKSPPRDNEQSLPVEPVDLDQFLVLMKQLFHEDSEGEHPGPASRVPARATHRTDSA